MGILECELETSFDKIRNSEQNLANFIADIMRLETDSDCALINTGTFRSNLLFPRGIFTMGDLRLILPYADMILQLELTGEQLVQALENGVSKYPALEGRFPAVRISNWMKIIYNLDFRDYLWIRSKKGTNEKNKPWFNKNKGPTFTIGREI